MSMIDSLLELSDNQSVAAVGSSADTVSTNVIDLGADGQAWEVNSDALANQLDGRSAFLNVQIGTALAGNTLLVKLYTHTTASVTSGTEVLRRPITTTAGVANAKFCVSLPSDVAWKRYIGVGYRGSGGAMTGGALDCWIGGQGETKNSTPPAA